MLKSVNQARTGFRLKHVPHFRLSGFAVFVLVCIFVIRVNLNRKVILRVNKFYEQRKFGVITLIHLIAQKVFLLKPR